MAVALLFDPKALDRSRSSIYSVARGLAENCDLQFVFDQKLGVGPKGGKVLGRFDFAPPRILIDEFLKKDSPRFRWTLCHEIGHYVLHRKIDRRRISRHDSLIDCRPELFPRRTAGWSDLHWIEWEANQFAGALLLPEPILKRELIRIQTELGIPNVGSVYVDDQSQNLSDFRELLSRLGKALGASRRMVQYRLSDLRILNDARHAIHDSALRSVAALKAIVLSGLNHQARSHR